METTPTGARRVSGANQQPGTVILYAKQRGSVAGPGGNSRFYVDVEIAFVIQH
ncbi:MAG: hypothetical protein JW902_10205 [Syntrophaceae bacterium]|nr:hypothetical protein [Syntrophaceae bacterium]